MPESSSRRFSSPNRPIIATKKSLSFSPRTIRLPKGGVVFLGDSITDLYPLQTYFPERVLINRGIGGDTTTGLLERLDDTVIVLEPTVLVLLIGVNDLSLGRSVEAIAADYATILDRLKTALPDLVIYVVSVYPVNGSTYAPLELIADKIPPLNALIAALADASRRDLYRYLSRLARRSHRPFESGLCRRRIASQRRGLRRHHRRIARRAFLE
ncbi:MAG: GDSL-type esterase/lipase family protein [Bacillus subtilis]|nr:GDSL-type esterase/lipase family protein [Bacillus subtilis]